MSDDKRIKFRLYSPLTGRSYRLTTTAEFGPGLEARGIGNRIEQWAPLEADGKRVVLARTPGASRGSEWHPHQDAYGVDVHYNELRRLIAEGHALDRRGPPFTITVDGPAEPVAAYLRDCVRVFNEAHDVPGGTSITLYVNL